MLTVFNNGPQVALPEFGKQLVQVLANAAENWLEVQGRQVEFDPAGEKNPLVQPTQIAGEAASPNPELL